MISGAVAHLKAAGINRVNSDPPKSGFRAYAGDVPAANRPLYEKAEAEARKARRGLWQQPNPQPPWEFQHGSAAPAAPSPVSTSSSGQIIGNKNSRIYHAPGCPDYNKVSEKNRVYFSREEDAERASFRRARNCS